MSDTNCIHDCDSCGENCPSRQMKPEDFIVPLSDESSIRHVYAIVSGKGGVGKSLVTTMMAVKTRAKGYKTAILDADITGPSIPKAFGIDGGISATSDGKCLIPATTSSGIEIMSTNLLLANEEDPAIWRGPVIANIVKQFWSETLWQNIDYMYIDMPPGTGDIPLTVFQSIKIDGIIIVTSPQELVSMIVAKAVNMAKAMNIPIVGLIENMSYYRCPDCGKEHAIFGESHIDEEASRYSIPVLAKIPIDTDIASKIDSGMAEYLEATWLDSAIDMIVKDDK